MNTIAIRFEVDGEKTYDSSQWLQRLGNHLQRELEVECELETSAVPKNTMDGGITAAVAIAGLVLSLLNTALAIVEFYRKQHQYASITIEGDGYTIEKKNLTPEEIEKIVSDIEEKRLKELVVKISSAKQ